ncbi:hypothetical protein [Ramlibacter sp.]|uniref:hypothetical protein n=1 Tax=Ramlibacter sp. TaxID=1917967 RepID=UPI003D11E8D8
MNNVRCADSALHRNLGYWSVDIRRGTVCLDRTAASLLGLAAGDSRDLHETLSRFSTLDRARLIEGALKAFQTRTVFDIRVVTGAKRDVHVHLIGGRGYSGRDADAELHGIVEALPPSKRFGIASGPLGMQVRAAEAR